MAGRAAGRHLRTALAVPFAALAAALFPLGASAQSSVYTDLRGPGCRSVEEGVSDCAGPYGHALRIEGGGASDDLRVRWPRGGEASVLPPPGRDYPQGASTVGQRVEWRVENGRAIGMVARRNLEGGRTWLEAYKIDGARLCWIANVEGANQNYQARRLADTYRDLPCP